ncbi:MAG: hypothetical protein MAG453_00825 [Calditrichaeota bacterium]|nr:hypothetical protein [Calditrichota bacterium]
MAVTPFDWILLIAVVLVAGVPAWLAYAAARKSLAARELADRLETQRQAFAGEIEKLRDRLEARQREEGERSDRALRDVTKGVSETLDRRIDELNKVLRDLITQFKTAQAELQSELNKTLKAQGESNTNAIVTLQERVARELGELREKQMEASKVLGDDVRASLDAVRKQNEEKLEKIRLTVDEKLHETLEERLGKSFAQVSERLEQVHKGLGEMQALASDVGGLKQVLTNVRSRGTFGEVQLEALLEQVFTPGQYEKNCATRPGSSERVEFALKLPGRDGDERPVLLPIDAKFPVQARERLEQTIEDNDKKGYALAQKELGRVMLNEAQKIHDKYVEPPHTTDFALMFVPTEGLYAEVLRVPELAESMHNRHHVIPVGPMNLFAILNSLQMGFRTLAIEKRSAEVWNILGAVKTEFGKFGGVLNKVGRHIDRARKSIDETGVRSRAIERSLRDVQALPEHDADPLIDEILEERGELPPADDDDTEPESDE